MLVSGETFTGSELGSMLPQEYGRHDITWVRRDASGAIVPESAASEPTNVFLAGVSSMLIELRESRDPGLATIGVEPEELDEYTFGTAFYRYVPAANLKGGEFHYDTGLDRSILRSNVGSAVLRFVGSWTTDGATVSYVFSDDPDHYDRPVGEVIEKGSPAISRPDNDYVVLFNEGAGLHGTAPASERPGEDTVIFSAAMYKEGQIPNIKFQQLRDTPRTSS
jgi:hypothetical protein